MDHRSEIFHDLHNAFTMLKTHLEAAGEFTHNAALHATLQRMDDLLKLYRQAVNRSEAGNSLQTQSLAECVSFLQEKLVPTLSAMYRVGIVFACGTPHDKSLIVFKPDDFRAICENLVANAVFAEATRIQIEVVARKHGMDLILRDNGKGMSAEQIEGLGLGFSTRSESGHGYGFHIVRQLAAHCGAVVRPPTSIVGVGTEVIVSFMKVGAALNPV